MKFMIALLLIATSVAARAQTMQLSSSQKQEWRGVVEREIKEDFDAAAPMFRKELEGKGTPEERRLAFELVKFLFYNKAYNWYRCGIDHMPFEDKIRNCILNLNRQIAVNLKLSFDYFSSIARRSQECEMRARLFEAEIEFPPYDFLEGAQLFDFRLLNDCLRDYRSR